MTKLRKFLVRRPVVTGFLMILVFTILSTLTWPITQINTEPEGYSVGTSLAKITMAVVFILLLSGFGWLRKSGLLSFGPLKIWLWVAPMILWSALFTAYGFAGTFWRPMPLQALVLAILFFTFSTALLEEMIYRGVMLRVMVEAWGTTRRGIYTAAMVSAVFFGSMHLFNLLIRPFPLVGLQVLSTVAAGFVYALIVLSGRSIWPVVFFHWAINFWVNIQVVQVDAFEETTRAWLIKSGTMVPVVVIAVYLMEKSLQKRTIVDRAGDEGRPMEAKLA